MYHGRSKFRIVSNESLLLMLIVRCMYCVITGSTVALHCCNGHSKINKKNKNFNPPVESQLLKILF